MAFDAWPLRGLPFLATEQGEVQGKVPPPCPALLERGAGMAGQSELSPHAPYASGTTSSQWVRIGPPFLKGLFQGPAIGSSCLVMRVGEGRCKRWKVPGEFPYELPRRY